MAHRRRADPVVSLSSIFEGIINELKDIPEVSYICIQNNILSNSMNCIVSFLHDFLFVLQILILSDFLSLFMVFRFLNV